MRSTIKPPRQVTWDLALAARVLRKAVEDGDESFDSLQLWLDVCGIELGSWKKRFAQVQESKNIGPRAAWCCEVCRDEKIARVKRLTRKEHK